MYSWQEVLFRLFLTSVFGALIGLERERKTGKEVNLKDILIRIEETEKINFTDFSINRKDTGLFIQVRFENINTEKSIELLNNL